MLQIKLTQITADAGNALRYSARIPGTSANIARSRVETVLGKWNVSSDIFLQFFSCVRVKEKMQSCPRA
jgi:hypothetical protein